MTSFVHPDFPSQHAGADRAANVAENISSFFQGSVRGASTVLLAAAVSGIVVVADEVVDTWSEDNKLLAWGTLWAVAFAATTLLAAPLRRLAGRARAAVRSYRENSARNAEDRKLWDMALNDARIMAEISRGMKEAGVAHKIASF